MLKRLSCLKRLLRDECGNVQSTEYILMIVLLAIGGIVGLATLRDQVAQELADSAVALENLDQSYSVTVPGRIDPMTVGPVTSSFSDSVTVMDPPNTGVGTGAPFGMTFTTVTAGSGEAGGTTNNEGK